MMYAVTSLLQSLEQSVAAEVRSFVIVKFRETIYRLCVTALFSKTQAALCPTDKPPAQSVDQ